MTKLHNSLCQCDCINCNSKKIKLCTMYCSTRVDVLRKRREKVKRKRNSDREKLCMEVS